MEQIKRVKKEKPFRDIPLSKLNIKDNVRKAYDKEHIATLKASIAAHGLFSPPLITPDLDNEGEFYIISGHCRYKAYCELNEEEQSGVYSKIPAKVVPSPENIAIVQLAENLHRADLKDFELETAIHDILSGAGSIKAIDLAEALGKHRTWVSAQISAYAGHVWLQSKGEKEEVPWTVARELARIDAKYRDEAWDKIKARGISSKYAEEIRKEYNGRKKATPPSAPPNSSSTYQAPKKEKPESKDSTNMRSSSTIRASFNDEPEVTPEADTTVEEEKFNKQKVAVIRQRIVAAPSFKEDWHACQRATEFLSANRRQEETAKEQIALNAGLSYAISAVASGQIIAQNLRLPEEGLEDRIKRAVEKLTKDEGQGLIRQLEDMTDILPLINKAIALGIDWAQKNL